MKNQIINNIEQLIAENERLKKENTKLRKANEEMNLQLKNFKKVKHDRDRYKERLDNIDKYMIKKAFDINIDEMLNNLKDMYRSEEE